MTNNSSTLNDCAGTGVILMYSSGNSGNLAVTQNVPVIIHQVCFQIPGTPLMIVEDEFTDLTVGIDIPGGSPVTEFPSYVPFDVDSILFCGILPLRFVDFDVRRVDGDDARLTWTTADEDNNSHFEVQRSADGRRFEAVGEVPAGPEGRDLNRYTFLDADPLPGRSYYRLKQFDRDGRYQYSPLRSLVTESSGASITISPNPADADVWIRYAELEADSQVQVVDMHGRVVGVAKLPAGSGEQRLDTGHLPAGIYVVRLTDHSDIRPFILILDR